MKLLPSLCIKTILVVFLMSLTVACEKDYSEIGSDIIDNQNIAIEYQSYPAKSYNKLIRPFQSNNLPNNLLGYYYDPNFGGTTAHFLAHLTPQSFNPDFGDNPALDSVVLTLPYTSRLDGDTYSLDSLYGGGPIKLAIYKNNFFLRNFDPGSDLDDFQRFYSNSALSQDESLNISELEGQLLYETDEFIPSNAAIDLYEPNSEGVLEVSETLAPSLRVKLEGPAETGLPEGYWESLFFEREDGLELTSSSHFYEYFRGLYFKVEPVNESSGSMIQMDFSAAGATLKLYYSYDFTSPTTDEVSRLQRSYDLGFFGNRISLFETNFDTDALQSIENANELEGDEQLFLKGCDGAMAVIELFSEDNNGNDFNDFMTDFREVINPGQPDEERIIKRLINEAFLEFYIDQTALDSDSDLPNRIYIYDLNNNTPLIDYLQDPSVNPITADSKFIHLVPLTTETDSQGNESQKYKVRLTEHLNNIIVNDSTNLKLGVVVSSNVAAVNSQRLLNYDAVVKGVPTTTVLSPKGIILHGSNAIDPTKQVKLNIYYTQPNN